MGNQQSHISIVPQNTSEMVSVERYTVDIQVRYKGTFREFVYVSKEYEVEIMPSNHQNPVSRYDPHRWTGVNNKKETVQVKKYILEGARLFLESREALTNEIQKHLAVS